MPGLNGGLRCAPVQRRTFTLRCVGRLLGLSIYLLAAAASSFAGPPSDASETIAAHLAAGEYAPAIALAENAPPAERDQLLGEIAGAQAEAGIRDASYATSALIGDDRVRSQTLGQLSSQASPAQGLRGGAAAAPDFDSLIDLIQSTVAPQSWDEVGGPGSIAPYAGGVYVDADGMLRSLLREEDQPTRLDHLFAASQPSADVATGDVRQASLLRKVSLTRLEKFVQLRLAVGQPLDEDMLVLAGLQRIEYVLLYPATGDLVVAGPADDWHVGPEGRLVGVKSGHPVLQLDDLVVILRQMAQSEKAFGCSITPFPAALARTKAFLETSAQKPLKPGRRSAWLSQLRDELGPQSIEFYGIDPRTRVARVLVEADYRMKLVGIGLEEGTLDVPSYLDMIRVPPGQAPPPMNVLRWWFTINYDALTTGPRRDIFALRGQGVKVLSENELLTAAGERVHTGKSDELNQQFAQNFTQHFEDLARKYPVYADLQNIFDLALVAALIQAEDLPSRVNWHMACFGDPEQYQVPLEHTPATVETVINHRVINQVNILAAVSGGVRVDPTALVTSEAIEIDRRGELVSEYGRSAPAELPPDAWWWD